MSEKGRVEFKKLLKRVVVVLFMLFLSVVWFTDKGIVGVNFFRSHFESGFEYSIRGCNTSTEQCLVLLEKHNNRLLHKTVISIVAFILCGGAWLLIDPTRGKNQ